MTTEEHNQREKIFCQIALFELEKKQLLNKANKAQERAIEAANELALRLENCDLADHPARRQVLKGQLMIGSQVKERCESIQEILSEHLECESNIRALELELHLFDVKHSSEYVTA